MDIHRLAKVIIAARMPGCQQIIVNRCCIAGIYASNAGHSEQAIPITPKNNGERQQRFQHQHAVSRDNRV
jgi:hypothetical protein